MKFSELKIKPEILKALQELGFEEAFPIQEKAVPPALQNRDIIGK
ncbi:MAG TPA: DEAD/DEAH box helicase, partial [archaeon]|nr:DEAD/DEAH box helicase [archaeon]